jgi:cell division protein FtsL
VTALLVSHRFHTQRELFVSRKALSEEEEEEEEEEENDDFV